MAIFEKTTHNKSLLDDTEKLTCTLETTQNIEKHTEYILRVQRGASKVNKWNVSHRYRDFASLQAELQQAGIYLPLPPKKLIGNMHPSFVAERQIALQNYINEVLKHQILALSLQVRRFLDPKNYAENFGEQALQTVSIALRGDGRFEMKGPLPDMGWRIRKHYFLVTDTESKANCILSYQNYGPDRHLCEKDMQSAFKSLQALTHPHIDNVLAAHNLETGAYVVRRIHEKGSIRDMLYGTEYSKGNLAKYGNPRIRKPLTTGQLAHYGLQVLQAAKYLHDKGLPHGHIHPGNITVENQKALLMDLENCLVGAPCLYRPYLVQLKKTASAESVDVYCFGRTLYEMAFAETLNGDTCDVFPDGISVDLESLLRLCLSGSNKRPPMIQDLIQHPLFSQPCAINGFTSAEGGAGGAGGGRPHLKFPASLKEELSCVAAAIEARLRNDQKMVRSARREVRIQEILSSEEKLKKQKRRAKKRDSIWKSTSSLSDTVRSQSASTTSSPTPPHIQLDAPTSSPPAPPAPAAAPAPAPAPRSDPARPAAGRSELLNAICGFDKSSLSRVNS